MNLLDERSFPMESTLDNLALALPERFSFYHLGEIRQEASAPEFLQLHALDLSDQFAVGFRLSGDVQAALVLLLDEGLDVSMYSEAGNVLASQLVTELARGSELDVALSPPLTLRGPQLERLTRAGGPSLSRNYLHAYGTNLIPMRVLLFSGTSGVIDD